MIPQYGTTRLFAILALFLLSLGAAQANVIRVNMDPVAVLDSPNDLVPIDVDGNGTPDFVFYYDFFQDSAFIHVNIPPVLQASNKVVVNGFQNAFGKDQILPLDSGAMISNASLFNTAPFSGNGPLLAQPSFGGGDIMEGRGDNYIGFQFVRNGATHFGWFLVNVDSSGTTATVKAYAYEDVPGVPITIGATSGFTRVEKITVAGYSGVTAIATPGGTLLMEATIFPDSATNPAVTWSVNDTSIATIDSTGLLRARRNGEVLVTATSVENPGIAGSATIIISEQSTSAVRTSPAPAAVEIAFLPGSRMLRVDVGTGTGGPVVIMVADLAGRTVISHEIAGATGSHLIDAGGLASGSYLAIYRSSQGTVTRKFAVVE